MDSKAGFLRRFFTIFAYFLLIIVPTRSDMRLSIVDLFNGQFAYQHVLSQVSFGARTLGSGAHQQTVDYIQSTLLKYGWKVKIQDSVYRGFPIRNIIAERDNSQDYILLGAHYDSRLLADAEPTPIDASVPGANDGASGVAILLELARVLPIDSPPVKLVFFDAEDNGNLDGRDWIMGSRAYVAQMRTLPRAVIILDMVGDKNLNLFMEGTSSPDLADEIWKTAAELGYGHIFVPQRKYSILDDHTPFLELGIPAVDIIDFDYPYWHTVSDTPEQIAPQSLKIVGGTLLTWILKTK